MPKLEMSKNNFWWVKPFKNKDLTIQLVDGGICQLSDSVKKMTKASKNHEG